jgi:ABC-type glycerol-3-phosphate transport system permease component
VRDPTTAAATDAAVRPRAEIAPVNDRGRFSFWAGRFFVYAAVIGGAIVFALPFFWMLSTSLKQNNEIFAYPPKWIPSTFTWEGYTEPFRNLPFLTFYRNTAIIAGINIVARLASASIVAFAFARMRFRGRGVLFIVVLSTMMLPGQVTLIPLYRFWAELGLVNTFGPLTIPSVFAAGGSGAFTVFLLRQYMMTIPFDLDDAAKLDGASWFRIYWNIVLPLAEPALGVAAIFQFTGEWNAFLEPLIYLQTTDNFTVQLGLNLLNGRYSLEYQQTMAQTILSLIPVLLVFFVAQRRYVQGIVVSGVKG